jgi:uncharacterized delta-60 repeat protein
MMAFRALSGAAWAGASTLLLLTITATAVAGRGDVDRSFGGDGKAELPSDTRLLAAAVQRDGKLVAVGEQGSDAGKVRLLVARFTRGGALDKSFNPSPAPLPLLPGGGGIYLGPVGTSGRDVAIQGGGRILVAGALTDRTGRAPRAMLLTRLRPNGSLDRSFSGDGRVVAFKGRRGDGRALAVHGKTILVAGSAKLPSSGDPYDRLAVAAFRANGAPARRFGSRGSRAFDFGRFSVAEAIAVRRDGRIVLAGSQRDNLQATSLLVARLTHGGARDRSFSGDGLFVRQYAKGAAYSAGFGVAAAARGKIVVGGAAASARVGSTAVALRLNRHGRPDRRFGGDGVVYMRATKSSQFGAEVPFPGASALVLGGGDILLAGYYDELGLRRPAIWALRPNGRLDRKFGHRGRTITGGQSAQLNDLVRHGRRLYGAGEIDNLIDPPQGLATRYH